tara:strand:+ start:999 stop:1613 length:615 start_codon:yes stop_codon:yes gene_type:complete
LNFEQAIIEIVKRAIERKSSKVVNDIIGFLRKHEERAFTAKQVANYINRPVPSVRRYLSPLADLGIIDRTKSKGLRGVKYGYNLPKPEWNRHLVKTVIYCDRSSTTQKKHSIYAITFDPSTMNDSTIKKDLIYELGKFMNVVCPNDENHNENYFDDIITDTIGYEKTQVAPSEVDKEAVYDKIKTGNDFIESVRFDRHKSRRVN